MPKGPSSRQFRKGTKSCVECRQRKLRCLPAADDSQPCQNCAAKGRNCVLQTEVGRSVEQLNVTSRDRIRKLEHSVGKLWSIVQDLRTQLGHTNAEIAEDDDLNSEKIEDGDGSGSESSDVSQVNRPTHLQQLFDNEILDTKGGTSATPDSYLDKVSGTSYSVNRARTALQALIPPRSDILALGPRTETWFGLYNALFPPFSLFKDVDEIIARYDELKATDADPVTVAALILWMAVVVQHSSPDMLQDRSAAVRDAPRFVRRVSKAVEDHIVANDTLASSAPALEVALLWIRLQLYDTNTKKLWLSLRRCIALAELIGLPRAKQGVGAAVWETICIVDRLVGLLFNSPIGTTAHGLPPRQEIMFSGGHVNGKAYFNNLARISAAIVDIDDAYLSNRADHELIDKVFRVDQDLRTLRAMSPENWWAQSTGSVVDILMQFWHHYLTIRAHLQLALRNSTESESTYSALTCTKACRDLADRYVNLRSALPPTFFAGRMIDLEAMTAAVFLIYNSHRATSTQAMVGQDDSPEASRQDAYKIVRMMESVQSQLPERNGSDVARKASKAVRLLDKLLNEAAPADSQALSIRVPMLGRLSVNRHSKTTDRPRDYFAAQPRDQMGHLQSNQAPPPAQQPNLQVHSYRGQEMDALDPWTMDLLMDDSLPFAVGDDFLSHDQWFTFSTENVA